MPSLTSTVPGAIATLQTHLQAVAAANSTIDPLGGPVGVFLGPPVGQEVPNYRFCIGAYETFELLPDYKGEFSAIPGNSYLKSEDYQLACHLQCWAEPVDPIARITDAFTLMSGVLSALTGDIGASGTITPSGSWQVVSMRTPFTGPFQGAAGWGIVVEFVIHVWNVQLSSPT